MPCLGHRPGLRAGPGVGWNAFAGHACACYRGPYGALCGWGGWAGKMRAWARSRTGTPAELEELLESCAEGNFDASLRLILAVPGMAAPTHRCSEENEHRAGVGCRVQLNA